MTEYNLNKHWLRHIATVPKGYCRILILRILSMSEMAMSGIEIIGKIEEMTKGKWKPSPGSIYPALKWLEEKGYIEIETVELAEKKYKLTNKGKTIIEESSQIKKEIIEKFREQRSLIREIFQDVDVDEVDEIFERIYSLAQEKKEINKKKVIEILNKAKEELIRVK
jgi:DNA-binding PadR family transcriptional regulator